MATGVVKWFSARRGFGFIAQENGPDVFVHASRVVGDGTTLQENQRVEFEVEQGAKGTHAVNVRPLP